MLMVVICLGQELDLDKLKERGVHRGWRVSLLKSSEHGVWMYFFMAGRSR